VGREKPAAIGFGAMAMLVFLCVLFVAAFLWALVAVEAGWDALW